MHKLRRFLNQNKNQIIRIIAIIIFIFIIIQVINYFVKKNNEKTITNLSQNNKEIKLENEKNKGLLSEKSAVTGKEVKKEQLANATDVIYRFVTYCSQQEIEKAYNLISEECKQQMYDSIDIFKQAYYKDVFNGQKKTCTIENWVGNTYKVNINEDVLSTGKDNGYTKQDYITVQKENGEYKLNINGYIGYSKINKTTTKDNISMEVIEKNTYKEYEEYTIKVTNNTENTIKLDDINSSKTLYLEDTKDAKYFYYNHELTDPTLTIVAGQTKEVTIKFYSSYISTKEIRRIVFSNMTSVNGQLSERLEFKANV